MSIRNLILGVNSITVSYLICYASLLQNATDVITKCDSFFITKRDRSLLQNGSGFLLQNATEVYNKMRQVFYYKCDSFITKCDSYYKMRRFYYKMRQLLQNATILLQNTTVITKCNVY